MHSDAAVLFTGSEFAHTQFGHIQVALINFKNRQVAGLHDIHARCDGVGCFAGSGHNTIAGNRAHSEIFRRGLIIAVTEAVSGAASVNDMIRKDS